MKQIQLFLIPQPGAKPEFLATLEPVDPSPVVLRLWNNLCPNKSQGRQVILEGYTKEGWAWKPTAANLQNVTVTSVDGRNKLPGFLNYLKQRQKSAYGRIAGIAAGAASGNKCACLVVPFVQTTTKNSTNPNRMECRISMDVTQIPNCSLKPLSTAAAPSASASIRKTSSSSGSKKPSAGGGGGLLGKLVGAQQRTNSLAAGAAVTTTTARRPHAAANDAATTTAAAAAVTATSSATMKRTTAQAVLADFRQAMLDKMMNFDLAHDQQVLKFSVSLAEQTSGLEATDKEAVTMQLLKYMVYEAAEETHDEWIAYREPSEFVDEAHFAIYKSADVAPPEVLEEFNKGDLPDEVRGQQKALQEERQRQVQQLERKQFEKKQQQAVYYDDEDDDLEVLNQTKRDRRTIEDYEREKREQQPQKKRR